MSKWSSMAKQLANETRRRLERIQDRVAGDGTKTTALAELIRPELRETPANFRWILEPAVAVLAMAAILLLVGIAGLGSIALIFSAAAIYAIITFVFGIRLDVNAHST